MNKRVKLVSGVGINDADYLVAINCNETKRSLFICPYYSSWSRMLERCYNKKYQAKKPTYIGCTVCDEWLIFSNFRSWMITQDWQGKQLDKDIIKHGNKIYCPEYCSFVDNKTNCFVKDNSSMRGEFPIGCSWHKRDKQFRSMCNNPISKKVENLGGFDTAEKAHLAWKSRKHQIACQLADLQTDERVVNALRTRYL